MCGIAGIHAYSPVNQSLYDALTVLQHRGQDAAGIVTEQDGKFFLRKSNGLVRDVFHTRHMTRLKGNTGIGHVRYPTAGSASSAESQPFYVNSPYGIVLAHNGNLTNQQQLVRDLFKADLRHVNTTSDSEVLLNVFAHELQLQGKLQPTEVDIFAAVESLFKRCRGAYAVVAMISGYGMLGIRDPYGIRPLVYGQRTDSRGRTEYMIASESVALDALGFTIIRDVQPGEVVYINAQGELFTKKCGPSLTQTSCIFEYVYFARPDSFIDGSSVYRARVRMGEYLANKIMQEHPEHDIDVVIPIPESSRTSALELANHLGVKFREGFVKNRYIGRTFIMPGQAMRKKSVKQKLNPIGLEFKDKNVLLVDDSIVRGTTCQQIIEMARESGANKVYFASAAPAIRYPNVYGIDMPAKYELIAHDRTDQEVGTAIGADWLVYQDLEDLIKAATPSDEVDGAREFDCSVFNGKYVTGDIDEQYLAALEASRNDSARETKDKEDKSAMIDLHNNA
ncbi:amidophosphoribosyltransferase [Gynuella sunshinyii]|uniref:Amidophosphoribosyltransferase n=1 Tax=Gynuella sunshinyii YC6258 TaxID=1445510 RepID=A0A0C5V6A3_9GAMM|nr:amidophosphoribosyltransferase [Gynuella sunshinyii]AJQ94995.1 glutamine phosphoribosylpyrophosphate amidotransferase [Gynuella sunshinyii YC6258]